MKFKIVEPTEDDLRSTSHYTPRVTSSKEAIDKMIDSIRNEMKLKEKDISVGVHHLISRNGSLQLEDGTEILYHDFVENGNIRDSSISIWSKDHKSHWEITGNTEQYQIFHTEYGDKKIKTQWGPEIDEIITYVSQQYNGTTVISIDNKSLMQLTQNEISGFETVMSSKFSDTPEMYSLFLNQGNGNIKYEGDYEWDVISRAIYDIKGLSQMQQEACIFSEKRLNELNSARKHLGIKPQRKPDEKVKADLKTKEEILGMCDPLLEQAQEVVNSNLEKIKQENSLLHRIRRNLDELGRKFSSQQMESGIKK